MLKQIKTLTKLELCNIYGFNVFRFSKDKKAKWKTKLMTLAWILLIAMLVFYVGGLSYGLIRLGIEDVIPAYLITISSLILFFFGIFKAGSVIYKENGLNTLCALPISQTAIVISRFLRMYAEDLIMTLVVLIPGFAVYAWFLKPGWSFYLLGILGALFVPLIPIAAASLLGALVTAISSRMKHKSLVASALSVLVVLLILFGSSKFSALEGNVTPEMLKELSGTVIVILEKMYPPAVWLGNAIITGNFLSCIFCGVLFLAVFAIVIALVSMNFQAVCRRLYSTSAKHNYQMQAQKRNSALTSLCKKEFRRYFSSSIYVTNTIIGPILGTIFSASLLFVDLHQYIGQLPISIDINGIVPFLLAGVFCMMTTSCTSISMEGKNWWIVKSLPLTAKTILDAKILMNLLLMLPFYLVSEVLLDIALKPDILSLLWMILIPAVMIVFSCVYGITINLHFPVFNWESEASVVKQSVSALLGGMGGAFLAILCVIPFLLVSGVYSHLLKFAVCAIILGITVLLYRKNNSTDLKEIS